ncbi:MAG: DUF3187 family protein [Deltaproteobacteria bacterium]|nr:MAG: DUF3187 family protein [Deltaproteobacteria bacterium]
MRFVVYSIGFFLFINVGNGFCKDSRDDWDRISGPIPIVNQTPSQLLFLQPVPDRAEPHPENRYSLSLTTAITNTLQWGKSDNYYACVDMEMIRTSLEVKYGIFSGADIGMSIPFVHCYAGVMDHSILEFEEWFNATRDLREKQEQYGTANTYTYFVKKNGKTFIECKEPSSGLGDLALTVKGKIWDEGDRAPCLSARFSVKIPTGDEDKAFGSGEVDYGIGLLLQKTVNRATAYLNADVIFPGQAFEQVDVSLRTFCEIMLGAEYKLSERFSGLMQLYYITRPFEDTGLEMLDKRIFNLLLGVSYLTKTGLYLQGGLVEDFYDSSNAGADITFFLNVGKNF